MTSSLASFTIRATAALCVGAVLAVTAVGAVATRNFESNSLPGPSAAISVLNMSSGEVVETTVSEVWVTGAGNFTAAPEGAAAGFVGDFSAGVIFLGSLLFPMEWEPALLGVTVEKHDGTFPLSPIQVKAVEQVVANAVAEHAVSGAVNGNSRWVLSDGSAVVAPSVTDWGWRNITRSGEKFGGPSSGLAHALAAVDARTGGALTASRTIVASGVVLPGSPQVMVGSVGSLSQKAASAADAGADLFLFPAANCDGNAIKWCSSFTVERADGGTMLALPVETVAHALSVLAPERFSSSSKLVAGGVDHAGNTLFPAGDFPAVPSS